MNHKSPKWHGITNILTAFWDFQRSIYISDPQRPGLSPLIRGPKAFSWYGAKSVYKSNNTILSLLGAWVGYHGRGWVAWFIIPHVPTSIMSMPARSHLWRIFFISQQLRLCAKVFTWWHGVWRLCIVRRCCTRQYEAVGYTGSLFFYLGWLSYPP